MSNILITGCSTGIGLATAKLLAKAGHTVYATMRAPQNSPELAELASKENLPISVIALDVDSDISVQEALGKMLADVGSIDILINNAGIGNLGSVEETGVDVFQKVMQTNFFGALRCIREILPQMRSRGKGLIINISSVAGEIYNPCFAAYCASKAALEAMSESLAGEAGQFGIRVAIVQPGVIETPIIQKNAGEYVDAIYPQHERLAAYLNASASNHQSPDVVAETILGIIEGQTNTFRNPVGLDAAPLLGWRSSLSDEDWIGVGSLDEESWIGGMVQMGVDVRPHLRKKSIPV